MDNNEPKRPKPISHVLILSMAVLKCSRVMASFFPADSCSSWIRNTPIRRSSSVKKVQLPGLSGITKYIATEIIIMIIPSKKKMLRHEWIMPQAGIFEKPMARRPTIRVNGLNDSGMWHSSSTSKSTSYTCTWCINAHTCDKLMSSVATWLLSMLKRCSKRACVWPALTMYQVHRKCPA